jgi:hypothetical protein
MLDLEMKKKVAQEIMDLMDQKEGERLKSHPKIVAASIQVDKKKPLDELMGKDEEESLENPKEEGLEMLSKDKEEGEEEISPEMVKKLLEMMNGR